MRKLFYILIFSILVFSCTSTKKIYKETNGGLKKLDSAQISGVYQNKLHNRIDSKNTRRGLGYDDPNSLWYKLNKGFMFKIKPREYNDSCLVILKEVNKRTLSASLVNKGDTLKTIKLKGRRKEKYFLVNRKILLIPIPFIFYLHREKRILIGITENNNLSIKEGEFVFVWIGFSGDNEWISEFHYKKNIL